MSDVNVREGVPCDSWGAELAIAEAQMRTALAAPRWASNAPCIKRTKKGGKR